MGWSKLLKNLLGPESEVVISVPGSDWPGQHGRGEIHAGSSEMVVLFYVWWALLTSDVPIPNSSKSKSNGVNGTQRFLRPFCEPEMVP